MSGAAVAGSHAMTLTLGHLAFTAEEMPVISPPEPYGQMMVSTSGRSSRISRPIVPCPAETTAK